MKEIQLTQGKFVLVDDWNYEWLTKWKWHAIKKKNTYYAIRFVYINNIQKAILMHREIMNTPKNKECDHIDHNGLNCLEENMRNCTHAENQKNRKSSIRGTSKFLGVSFVNKKYKDKTYRYIIAHISVNKKELHIGQFKTEELAALAYNEAAKKYHGEFANLNIIQ